MNVRQRIAKLSLLYVVLLIQGCASSPGLMPTPNVFSQAGSYPINPVNANHQNNLADVLYMTDREPKVGKKGDLTYGSERSSSLVFGQAQLRIGGEGVLWPTLAKESAVGKKRKKLLYEINFRDELVRFPSTPYRFSVVEGKPVIDPQVKAEKNKQEALFRQMILSRLERSNSKNIVMFIHGYNTSFDEAVYTLGGIWHYLERQSVPLAYSWPADHGGLFGYFIDRESGEYTIYHLKEAFRMLAAIPEVENIDIIAHSRGTDVTTTALRELVIESRAMGKNPLQHYRIRNLILAAPDLDFGVISQRLMAEMFGAAIGQITIYTTQSDKALRFAQRLMSGIRFGRVRSKDLTEDQQKIFSKVKNVNIVEAGGITDLLGHDYFYTNPAVSSDLVLVLRDNAKPGSALRPLTHLDGNFWKIPQDYPNYDQEN